MSTDRTGAERLCILLYGEARARHVGQFDNVGRTGHAMLHEAADHITGARADRDDWRGRAQDSAKEVEKLRADIRCMVEKAAANKLDGYRELGARAAAAENAADSLRVELSHFRARTVAAENDAALLRAELQRRPDDRASSPWISVKDRQPSEFGEYLGATRARPYGWVFRYNSHGWSCSPDYPVTHWMPLVKRPDSELEAGRE